MWDGHQQNFTVAREKLFFVGATEIKLWPFLNVFKNLLNRNGTGVQGIDHSLQ